MSRYIVAHKVNIHTTVEGVEISVYKTAARTRSIPEAADEIANMHRGIEKEDLPATIERGNFIILETPS